MAERPRFELGWYNGWSPDERRAATPIQREAVRNGTIPRPTICSICGSTRDVWLHDERYDRPLDSYHVCRSCHRTLHNRFDQPEPWLELVERYARKGAWFMALTMDAESQRRAFSDSYPNGLPEGSGR